jgi:hypothetical protein
MKNYQECEALCTRLGIMVSGRLQCLGSCQHLKSKYGVSYQMEVRVSHTCLPEDCLNIIKNSIPSAMLDEGHGSFLRIKADKSIDLAVIFSFFEDLKAQGKIVSYSVSQSTLEQIFIKFAAMQEEEKFMNIKQE